MIASGAEAVSDSPSTAEVRRFGSLRFMWEGSNEMAQDSSIPWIEAANNNATTRQVEDNVGGAITDDSPSSIVNESMALMQCPSVLDELVAQLSSIKRAWLRCSTLPYYPHRH